MSVTVGEGLVTRACTNSVEKTLEQLEGMQRAKGVTIFAVVDHSGEAAKVGLTMRPTKLLIFGRRVCQFRHPGAVQSPELTAASGAGATPRRPDCPCFVRVRSCGVSPERPRLARWSAPRYPRR